MMNVYPAAYPQGYIILQKNTFKVGCFLGYYTDKYLFIF